MKNAKKSGQPTKPTYPDWQAYRKRHWTEKGVVVYKRTRRKFTPKDLERITNLVKGDLAQLTINELVLKILLNACNTAIDVVVEVWRFLAGFDYNMDRIVQIWRWYWASLELGQRYGSELDRRLQIEIAALFGLPPPV